MGKGYEDDETLRKHIEFMRQKDKEWKEQKAEKERQDRIKRGLPADPPPPPPKHFDHPDTMENDVATVLYVLTMIVGTIFTDRWLIYVVATFVWLKHIFRHQIKDAMRNKKDK